MPRYSIDIPCPFCQGKGRLDYLTPDGIIFPNTRFVIRHEPDQNDPREELKPLKLAEFKKEGDRIHNQLATRSSRRPMSPYPPGKRKPGRPKGSKSKGSKNK